MERDRGVRLDFDWHPGVSGRVTRCVECCRLGGVGGIGASGKYVRHRYADFDMDTEAEEAEEDVQQ